MGISRAYAQAAEPGNFFVAGKNKIINGDFRINQRGFTSNTTSGAFNFDRWLQGNSLGTFTVTPQTFTLGAAPVAGYEGTTFLRGVVASHSTANDTAYYNQKIESVRTLAGQTVTVSFWAKAGSGTPKIGTTFVQLFGSGGSPSSAVVMDGQSATISTSWARYSFVFNIPSISGKTLGTANDDSLQFEIWCSAGSNFNSRSGSVGLQNNTFDIWGVQVEAGSVATPFTTATGTLAGELAACQRYYWRNVDDSTTTGSVALASGMTQNGSGTEQGYYLAYPVTMRVRPTFTLSNLMVTDYASYNNAATLRTTNTGYMSAFIGTTCTAAGAQYRPAFLAFNDGAGQTGFLEASAEL